MPRNSLRSLKRQAVEAEIGAKRVDAVLRVTGVVDEVERLVPLASRRGEHDGVQRRQHLGKGGRSAPMARRAAVDRVHVHQRHERARRARIGNDHVAPRGVTNGDSVFWCSERRRRETTRERHRGERWSFNILCNGRVGAHKPLSLLAARDERPAAFDRRCIPPDRVAPRSNTLGILARRALSAGRSAGLGATRDVHHGLLGMLHRARDDHSAALA